MRKVRITGAEDPADHGVWQRLSEARDNHQPGECRHHWGVCYAGGIISLRVRQPIACSSKCQRWVNQKNPRIGTLVRLLVSVIEHIVIANPQPGSNRRNPTVLVGNSPSRQYVLLQGIGERLQGGPLLVRRGFIHLLNQHRQQHRGRDSQDRQDSDHFNQGPRSSKLRSCPHAWNHGPERRLQENLAQLWSKLAMLEDGRTPLIAKRVATKTSLSVVQSSHKSYCSSPPEPEPVAPSMTPPPPV